MYEISIIETGEKIFVTLEQLKKLVKLGVLKASVSPEYVEELVKKGVVIYEDD